MPRKNRESEVYDYIMESLKTKKYAPTLDEVRRALGFKTRGGVKWHIDRLVKAGKLRRMGVFARGIYLDKGGEECTCIRTRLKNRRIYLYRKLNDAYPYHFVFVRLLDPCEEPTADNAFTYTKRRVQNIGVKLSTEAAYAVMDMLKVFLETDPEEGE